MKTKILLLAVFAFISAGVSGQIHSTLTGGLWNDPNTWVGSTVPGAGNDVIIDGPVVQGSASGYTILTENCNNLTITASGSLKNADYGGGTGVFPLVVNGNVVNNGVVSSGPSDLLQIIILGDLQNNNIWGPYITEFQGSADHNLSLAAGKSFGSKMVNNGSASFTALTDMLFTCNFAAEGNLNHENFYLNGKTLHVGNHSIELRQCLINSGTLTGDFHIKGNFRVDMNPSDTMVFIGNITVDDTLSCNQYNGGYAIEKLKIVGNITNNGLVSDNDGDNPDEMSLLITGNITNNGLWTCNFVNFIGTETQFIYQSPGKQFDSFFSDLDLNSKVQALSDITITKDFNLNGSTLEMEGATLHINGWLYNGFINNTKLYNGFLKNLTSLDNLTIEGKVTVEAGNKFQKNVVVNDTLQSKDYGGGSIVYTLTIDGDIQNNGVIQDIAPDDQLSLEIFGDMINNGQWMQGFTKFVGTKAHHISVLAGHILAGQFYDLDSIGSIVVTNDVAFSGDFNLGNALMDMQGNALTFRTDKWLYNGYFRGARLRNGMLSHMHLTGDTEVNGYVQLAEGNDASGNVYVNDTLTVIAYGGGSAAYTFTVYGNVVNRGLLGQLYDDGLYIKVNGNMINEGVWNAWQNYFLFYSNTNICSLTITNKGTSDLQVNNSSITGSGADAFTIISGGGMQTVAPGQSYFATIQFTPAGADATAQLTLDCNQVGSLNSIALRGFNYASLFTGGNNETPVSMLNVLGQNYPNPFAETTTITWQLSNDAPVILKVYDFTGRVVRTLLCGHQPKGEHTCTFDGSDLPEGVYFYQLQVNGEVKCDKMIIAR